MLNQGLVMLNQALEIAKLEQKAMENEDYEDAISLSVERGRITKEAWDFFENDIRDEYRERLLELNAIHSHLKSLALDAHAKVQASLAQSKRERVRMRGYQSAISHALH
ncbi:MAG: hypothetical protein IJT59_00770 [Desulfovibrionaceae bacterium]|nr:hypothetical protein [Desulfovibrionaceae bacterium]